MARVVHFDISAENVDRAIQFYESIFGWKFTKWEGPMAYWLISTGPQDEPGIDGGLSKRKGMDAQSTDAQGMDAQVTNTIEVESIDQILDNKPAGLLDFRTAFD